MMAKLTKTRELLINEFIHSLEEDQQIWKKTWKVVHPVNAISRHQYRGLNRLLLSFIAEERGYKDPRWITFNQVKQNEWKLVDAKGKGVPVEYWSPYDIENRKKVTLLEAKEIIKEDPNRIKYIAQTYIVFNASLVDGIPKYEIEEKQVKQENIMDFFKNYLETEGIILKHGGDSACYIPTLDKIKMPQFENFDSEFDYYDTLAHEIGHSTGHEKRLNRNLTGCFGSESYAKEELRAEISSAFLNAELNIPISEDRIKNNKAYVQNWISILKKEPNELFKAIQDAEKISEYVLEKGDYEFYIEGHSIEHQPQNLEMGEKMDSLTREEIKSSIILDLEKAWENKNEMSYWLEKLPMVKEWDEEVHNYITQLKNDIRHQDRESFDFNVDELVDVYFNNQENYEFYVEDHAVGHQAKEFGIGDM